VKQQSARENPRHSQDQELQSDGAWAFVVSSDMHIGQESDNVRARAGTPPILLLLLRFALFFLWLSSNVGVVQHTPGALAQSRGDREDQQPHKTGEH
jgi:hypothetical protein